MAENVLDSSPTRHLVPVVRFEWGDPLKTVSYARWDSPLGTILAAPELDVEDFQQGGGATDNPLTFVIDRRRSPVDKMSRPFPHAPVNVVVLELDPGREGTSREVFRGTVTKTVRNAQGFHKLVKVQVSGHRERLKSSLGAIIDSTCGWTFADGYPGGPGNCGIDPAPLRFQATVTAIEGNVVTVTSEDPIVKNYLAHGSLGYDGLFLFVQSNDTVDGAQKVVLVNQPPPEWQGASVTCMPGCDKRLPTCRSWQNEHRYGGIGIAIPAYNPMIDFPG